MIYKKYGDFFNIRGLKQISFIWIENNEISNRAAKDFYFVEEINEFEMAKLIVNLCSKRLPKHYHVNPISDIHVLSPVKNGLIGTNNLNLLLQSKLNSEKTYLKRAGLKYHLHDKVMQITNNYDKDVYNGDIGIIQSI